MDGSNPPKMQIQMQYIIAKSAKKYRERRMEELFIS